MPLEVFAISFYMKALKTSPLSLVAPFTSLTPVFLFFVSYFLLGEVPHLFGVLGVFLVVVGSFFLNQRNTSRGKRDPWDIYRDRGVRYMVLAAFLYAFLAGIGKKMFLSSPTLSLIALYSLLSTSTLMLYMLFRFGWRPFKIIVDRPYRYLPMALLDALGYWTNFTGILQTDVSYFIAIKRTSLFFAIVYGGIFFKESNLRQRLFGGVLMLIGVLLVAL
jgi:drug/metabolite transporter (DMT)-like permease